MFVMVVKFHLAEKSKVISREKDMHKVHLAHWIVFSKVFDTYTS